MKRLLRLKLAMAALLIGISAIACFLFFGMRQSAQLLESTQKVLYRQSDLLSAFQDMMAASRGRVLSSDSRLLDIYNSAAQAQPRIHEELKELLADNATQQANLSQLESHSKTFRAVTENLLKQRSGELVIPQRVAMDAIRLDLSRIVSEETRLLTTRENSTETYFWLGGAALGTLVLLGFILMYISWKLMKEFAKENEGILRGLFDFMPQLGWTALPDGFIDWYNQGWYNYSGTTFEEMQGWGWEKIHDPAILPEVNKRWREAIKTQTPFEMKFPLRRKDGVFRWFLTRINPIRNEHGKLIRWVGINTDIQDELERAEKLEQVVQERTTELRLARDEAVAANEAKSRFLSTVSHEVRTPMAGVIGMVEMLHISAQDEQTRSMSKVTFESCKRLLQILNDLLDASKLQAGAVKLEYRYFSVRPILGDIVQLVSVEATKKSLEITSRVAPDVPEIVCGDELRVRQILQNLAFNAVKFTKHGHVEIWVELLKKESDKTTLKFSVTDSGIGISDEQQKKVFEPFVQADDSTTRVYGGTGLGLSISRTLVDLMEGEIGVESKINEGSTFWVVIPFRDDLCQTG